jgi:hypothetical protein
MRELPTIFCVSPSKGLKIMSLFGRNNNKKDEPLEPVAPPISLSHSIVAVPVAPIAPTAPEPPKPVGAPEPPTLSADKTLDFQAIYQFARVPDAPFTAEQTLAMLEQLPNAMPLEMKRQTVQVTLGAMGTAIGATRSTIVADADQKRTTLQQYADSQGKKTDDSVAGAESEIAELQRQIAQKENEITSAKEKQACIRSLCDSESSRLESVLSFFGEEHSTASAPTSSPVTSLNNNENPHGEEDLDLTSFALDSDEELLSTEPPLRLAA